MNLDERFWQHRQRATSYMGIAGAFGITALLLWRWFFTQQLDWPLLAILGLMGLTKFGTLFVLFRFR